RASACLARIGVALLLLCALDLHARPVELPAGADQLSLTPHLHYRHDAGATDRMQAAFAHQREGRFEPVPGGNATFGFQRGAFWFLAAVVNTNPDEQRWLHVQDYPLIDSIVIWDAHAV